MHVKLLHNKSSGSLTRIALYYWNRNTVGNPRFWLLAIKYNEKKNIRKTGRCKKHKKPAFKWFVKCHKRSWRTDAILNTIQFFVVRFVKLPSCHSIGFIVFSCKTNWNNFFSIPNRFLFVHKSFSLLQNI